MRLNSFKVLSEADIEQIHEATLDILEETGIKIDSEKILEIIAENGVEVDYTEKIARFPKTLVEDYLQYPPATIDIFNRNKEKAFTLGEGKPICASGHNAIYVLDSEKGVKRDSTVQDVEEFAKISDYLKDIEMIGIPLMPQDVSGSTSLLYAIKAVMENSSKPVFFSTDKAEINRTAIMMAKEILEEEDLAAFPYIISQLSPTSPLYWEGNTVDGIYEVVKEGIPLTILPEPFTGVTAPYTLAGLLTVHNIEALSGIIIAQLIKEGSPVIYGSSWTTYDMKYANVIIGSPETSILRIAGSQMAKYYNIPSHTTAPNSDAHIHDEQNAWEKLLSNICAICSCNDLVVNSGMFAGGLTVSLEQLVIDDELNGISRRLLQGIEVNEDTIAVDTIKKVGARGDYLTEDHTLKYLRSDEHREVTISNMKMYDGWQEDGAPDVVDNARDVVKDILNKETNTISNVKKEKLTSIIKTNSL